MAKPSPRRAHREPRKRDVDPYSQDIVGASTANTHAEEGLDGAAQMFREALEGGHGAVVRNCLSILRNRFAGEYEVEGYRKDGPVAVALFVVRRVGCAPIGAISY